MTKKLKKEWIKACKELLAHYKGEKEVEDCPLCYVAPQCGDCLWIIFDKAGCEHYAQKFYSKRNTAAGLRVDCRLRWRKHSIKRLNRWIKRLESE